MKTAPILIVDKIGFIGNLLALKLSKEFSTVFVGGMQAEGNEKGTEKIIRVAFSKKYPTIPDGKYSHIIVIDDEGLGLDFLSSIIKKTKSINAEFIFAQELSVRSEYWSNKIFKEFPGSRIVLYGDAFDNTATSRHRDGRSTVNRFIYQAQKNGGIKVPGDGMRRTYPVFIEDVINGLVNIVFGFHKSSYLFFLFPKHSVTELSLAHMIQKANPEIALDFIEKDLRREIVSIPVQGKYLIENNSMLAKQIRKINIKEVVIIKEEKRSKTRGKGSSVAMFILWAFIFLTFFPLILTVFFSFLGLSTLSYAKTKESFYLSGAFFYMGKKTANVLIAQARIIGQERKLKNLLEDINLGSKISEGAVFGLNSRDYFVKVISGASSHPARDFSRGRSDLKSAIVSFEKLKAEGKILEPFRGRFSSVDPLVRFLSNIEDILPDILGIENERKYLVLFQNSLELRPGGGVIDHYGILKLSMGKIVEFSVHDVSDADGQLRGHVEPPYALRRYLPIEHWYLRDSNFDVDFAKSASLSSRLLNIETGENIAGVIGIDLTFVKNILRSTGPVYVDEYKELVGESNLYALINDYNKKQSFLRSLYGAIAIKISSLDFSSFSIAQEIAKSLEQKHLTVALNDAPQNILGVNGWSSALWDERKDGGGKVNDYLGINEANLGGNRINAFIYRNISQEVMITGDGDVSSELTISYKNDSVSLSGGDYKNYLRIILPLNAALSEISINGISQSIIDAITDPLIYEAKNFKISNGLEVEKTIEGNKTIYGFMVKVPAGEIVKINIKYGLARKIDTNLNTFSYNLKLFKQPGIDSIPYSFSLLHPSDFGAVNVSDAVRSKKEKLLYSEKITKDENILINFAKK